MAGDSLLGGVLGVSDSAKLWSALSSQLPLLGMVVPNPAAYYVSRSYAADLRKRIPGGSVASLAAVAGVSVVVSDHLPIVRITGRIVQRDRFATYDAKDMHWAEPAGLASWETEETHCVQYDPKPIEFREMAFSPWPTLTPPSLFVGGW